MLTLDQVRNLKGAEFKVLATLAGLFATEPDKQGEISGRDLAEAAGIERRNVQLATDSLTAKKLIRTTPGRGPKPPTFHLEFLRTEKITGVVLTPVAEENAGKIHSRVAEIHSWVASKQRQYKATGVKTTPAGDLFEQASGVKTTPVEAEGQGDAGTRVDFDLNHDNYSIDAHARENQQTPMAIIEQVLAAKPRDWDAGELKEARKWVQGYQCAVGDKFNASPKRNRNPPDDDILAQILTAAGSLANLIGLWHTLNGRREPPGDSYGWYVAVALDLIHGIKPKVQKQVRQQLRIARKPSPPAIAGEQQLLGEVATADALDADPEFRNQLLSEIAEQRRKGARG
jgi:hypothetical protein